jgi:protein gp37
MADKSKIEWTEATWNPIRGCSRISEGCRNCYAEVTANRFKGEGQPYEGLIARTGQWNGEIKFIDVGLAQPLRWKRPRMIFVNSMSDLFHENLPIEQIAKIYAVMCLAHWHIFQVLTKRAERMHSVINNPDFYEMVLTAADEIRGKFPKINIGISDPQLIPPKNVWLGVSVENQDTANERVPLLLQTPASVRWLSAEPLLSPLSLESALGGTRWIGGQRGCSGTHHGVGTEDCPRHKHHHHDDRCNPGLDWVVVGGESAQTKNGFTAARPMHPDWVRTLRDQCNNAQVAFFFKQWGSYSYNYDRDRDDPDCRNCLKESRKPGRWVNLEGGHGFHGQRVHYGELVGKKKAGRILDGRTWDEYPGAAK